MCCLVLTQVNTGIVTCLVAIWRLDTAYTHIHTHTQTHTHSHTNTHTYTQTNKQTHTHIYTHTNTHTHNIIQTHTHTHKHTHHIIHTHRKDRGPLFREIRRIIWKPLTVVHPCGLVTVAPVHV